MHTFMHITVGSELKVGGGGGAGTYKHVSVAILNVYPMYMFAKKQRGYGLVSREFVVK